MKTWLIKWDAHICCRYKVLYFAWFSSDDVCVLPDETIATNNHPLAKASPASYLRYNLSNSQGTMCGSFISLVINEPAKRGYMDDFASDRVGFRVVRKP